MQPASYLYHTLKLGVNKRRALIFVPAGSHIFTPFVHYDYS